jgi:hypothetical protein
MLTILMHFRTSWTDYFTGSPTNFQSNEYRTRLTLSDTSVYVLNCLFRSITSTSNGGALHSTSVQYLLIESSSFLSCRTSGRYGGAIFFENTGSGQCVLNEVCGYDCSSTYTSDIALDLFSHVYVYNVASSKNYVNYSSISRCLNESLKSWYILRNHYGKICFQSVNISMNKCGCRTVLSGPFSDSNSVTSSFSYSTFVDNIVTDYTCIALWTGGAKNEIKSCNIIRNTQPLGNGEGTFRSSGNLMIEDSCILENKATNIFYLTSSSYTITLSNCTFDSTSNNGYLTTQNTVTKSFILALNHMSTQNCHSEYDSAGTLTPIIQSPSYSMKLKLYYSCERFFHLPSQGNFVLLISAFLILKVLSQ